MTDVGSRKSQRALLGRMPLIAMLVLVMLLPSGASARPTAAGATVSGLSLTGPLSNVTLCTKYSYRVQVVSPQSYKGAVISFFVPPSGTRTTKTVNLVAHKPWHGSFTAEFATTNNMSTKGIEIAVLVLPPHRGLRVLFNKAYAVTPAAIQPPNPPQFCGGPPPPWFGS